MPFEVEYIASGASSWIKIEIQQPESSQVFLYVKRQLLVDTSCAREGELCMISGVRGVEGRARTQLEFFQISFFKEALKVCVSAIARVVIGIECLDSSALARRNVCVLP